jgi:hypothetical protein
MLQIGAQRNNSSYGLAVSKSKLESHRASLERTKPSMQRPKTSKSKRFIPNPELMGKNTDVRPGQTNGLHLPPLGGRNPSKWFLNKVLIWKIVFFAKTTIFFICDIFEIKVLNRSNTFFLYFHFKTSHLG